MKQFIDLINSIKVRNSIEDRFESSISYNNGETIKIVLFNMILIILGFFSIISLFDKSFPYDLFNKDIYNQILKTIISLSGILPLSVLIQNFINSLNYLGFKTSKDIKRSFSKYKYLHNSSRSALKKFNRKKWGYVFIKDLLPLILIALITLSFFSQKRQVEFDFVNFLIYNTLVIFFMSMVIAYFTVKYTETDFNVEKTIKTANFKELKGLTYVLIKSREYYIDYKNLSICYIKHDEKILIYLKESLNLLMFWQYIAIKEYYSEQKNIITSYKNEGKIKDNNEIKSINESIKYYGKIVNEIENTVRLSSKQLRQIQRE